VRVAKLAATRIHYYLVVMDKNGPDATRILFNADEVEPDV
jgi:hypothetical protein